MVNTNAWMVPTNSPKNALSSGGNKMLYVKCDTTRMMMDPPMTFPNIRKEMDTILASSPITFNGIMKNIG